MEGEGRVKTQKEKVLLPKHDVIWRKEQRIMEAR